MSDPKKDLTSLTDYAKAMQDAGTAAPVRPGSVMEEQKIEKVDDFESLEDYGKANPTPEPIQEPESHDFPTTEEFAITPEPLVEAESEAPSQSQEAQNDFPTTFESTGDEAAPAGMDFGEPPATTPAEEFEAAPITPPEAPENTSSSPETAAAAATLSSEPVPESVIESPHPPSYVSAGADTEPQSPLAFTPLETREPLRPAIKTPSSSGPKAAMERVKQYSEQMTPGRAAVPASFPFSLLITGRLAPEEKERLLDILSREQMGIREIDLEPQFEGGKILIPRISEYAGVLLVSALRSTSARMRLGPSDTIFATKDTQEDEDEGHDFGERKSSSSGSHLTHLAENIPISSQDSLPGLPIYLVIDVVTASAALKSQAVETETSSEFQDLLDALSREIKYKAFRKGACAILNFNVQLTSLALPMHYRVIVTGSAVKRPGT